jgi:hypothetical protein
MAQRRLIVGVIGGDFNLDSGEELGKEVARRGWIVMTGGQVRDRSLVVPKGEVKEAALLGAASAESEGAISRLIGILPEPGEAPIKPKKPSWNRPTPYRLFLHTGLTHNVRNVINGRTPDVLVAFGGSRGTLAEIAFGLSARRTIFVHRGFDRLRRNLEKYFGPGGDPDDRDVYFQTPLRFYPAMANGVDELLANLRHLFAELPTNEVSATELANRIAATTTISERELTGFPGLPHEKSAGDYFERIVGEISQ